MTTSISALSFPLLHSEDRPRHLIGLYSPTPGCGKSTAAWLLERQGFTRISFATPLRAMLRSLLSDLGYSPVQADHWLQQRKDQVLPELGVSPRQLLRTLGTEWGRCCVHPSIWLQTFSNQVKGQLQVVVDDVRFANEAQMIQQLGGQIWLVRRPAAEQAAATLQPHASEGDLHGWSGFSQTLTNDGDLDALQRALEAALRASGLSEGMIPLPGISRGLARAL